MSEDSADFVAAIDPALDTDLKLEAAECRRHGYILTGKFLGQGAYAKVYLGHATQAKINSNMKLRGSLQHGKKELKVAIKIISTDSAPKVYVSKFLPREIATMNRCYKHVNVLQLFDIFATVKRVYLILEFAAGGDLLTYINRCCTKNSPHSVPEDSARSIFTEIAAGLRFIHRREIAHRDLKCENLLLSKSNTIKLSDFGFAIDTGDTTDLLKTHCGSYAYAPPEILRRQKYNGKMADLWSLGVVLFAMVNGGLPFKESDAKAVLAAMKKPVYFKSHLSTECKELIRGLLRIKPPKRLTIDEVLCHSWVTKLHPPDFSLILKIPSPSYASPNQTQGPDGDFRIEEIEQQIKAQYAQMDNPANVSKYLCNKMKLNGLTKASRLPSYPVSTREKMTHKEVVAKDTEKLTNAKTSKESRTQSRDVGELMPRKTKTTECFEPPIPRYNSPIEERMEVETIQNTIEEVAIQGLKIQENLKSGSRRNEVATGLNRPIAPVTIKNLAAPVPKKTLDTICHQRAWVTSRAESNSPGPALGKTATTRESASPNVINIRIDQVVEMSSNTYNEFQRVKQHSKGLRGKVKCGRVETKRKCATKPDSKRRKPKAEDRNSGPKSVSCEPKSTNPNDRTLPDSVKFVCIPTKVPEQQRAKEKSPEIKEPSKSPKNKNVHDKRRRSGNPASPKEQRRSERKVRHSSAKEKDAKTAHTTSQRASHTSVTHSNTVRYHATTPSRYVAASQLPCKSGKVSSPTKCFSPLESHARDSETCRSSPEHESEGRCVQVRPFSRKIRGIEGGEWAKVSGADKSSSRDLSPSKMRESPQDRHHNPADAWQLPSKYQQNLEKNMNAQQLLSYRVKKGHYGHTFHPHEKYSQKLPYANNPAGYGYLVTDDPDYQMKLEHIRQRRSVQGGRIHEFEQGESHRSTPHTFVNASYDNNHRGNRLLFKRLQQPRKTISPYKQLQEQALFAARSKKHFLPFPSCGLATRKSDLSSKNEFARPLVNKPTSKSRKQTVVLKLHKS